jgi:phosphatidate phosphatase APP1
MGKWQRFIAQSLVDIEERFDLFKYRMRERMGNRPPILIYPYKGYGDRHKVYIRGRVLEDKGIVPPTDNDSIWENLVNMYRRFDSDEIPYATIRARFQDQEKTIKTDVEGHFQVYLDVTQPLPEDKLWHQVELELMSPRREGQEPAKTTGNVLIYPKSARYGVISDIDDTVLHTDATNLIVMARNVFLGNAHTRLPFKGVSAFYRAMFHGAAGNERNPLFYVSSSPWNLYDLLCDFFNLQEIPIGPVLFLRDWGLNEQEIIPSRHKEYKMGIIQRIMEDLPDLPFILLGDSGQEDPEIYHEVVHKYPERVLAVYIRNVSRGLKRPEAINLLAEEVLKAGSTLILADDTLPMAEHAAEQGWISPGEIPLIRSKVREDEAPPSPLEKLIKEDLEEEEEPETVVIDEGDEKKTEEAIEEGAIEETLKEEDKGKKKPPSVVVKGDKDEDDQPK